MPLLWCHGAERVRGEDAGAFTGGGRKIVWHTTEGSESSVDGALDTLLANRSAPHFVLGHDGNHRRLVQMLPLDVAGRALVHAYPQETNRANCIQIELCGHADTSGEFPIAYYRMIAHLARWIEHVYGVPRRAGASFSDPERLGPDEFVSASGHFGHVHVPGNTHYDPGTGFRIDRVLSGRRADGGWPSWWWWYVRPRGR
jgi:N-acetyl-anhydromuramyl-L-alanine amidase AmpD